VRVIALPAALFVGFGLGFAMFRGPAVDPRLPQTAHLEEKAAAGPTTPLPEDAATLEIKAQRLIAAALLKAPEIDRNAELYLAIQAFKAEDFARLMTGAAGVQGRVGRAPESG